MPVRIRRSRTVVRGGDAARSEKLGNMKSVLIPGLTVLVTFVVLAGLLVWAEVSGGMTAQSADAGDGYYITEIRRSGR